MIPPFPITDRDEIEGRTQPASQATPQADPNFGDNFPLRNPAYDGPDGIFAGYGDYDAAGLSSLVPTGLADDTFSVTCSFCGATLPSVEAAIDAGWYPSFWYGRDAARDESGTPACPGCIAEHCLPAEDWDGDGPILKDGHVCFVTDEARGIQAGRGREAE
jgi:hypothetical protein